jgi:glycerol-3-phosphate acyltransferase PlsY
MLTVLTALITGYLLGSIPTGVWTGRIFRGIDVRDHGSRSAGATNVFRVLGAKLAVFVLLVDIAKGYLACYLASSIDFGDTTLISGQLAILAGIAAVIGHLIPLFAGFKGGKGIATGAGLLLYVSPLEVGFALVIFVSIVYISRYVSLGSIAAALFYSSAIMLEKYAFEYPVDDWNSGLAILIAILVVFTHRGNIRRLLNGTENRFGTKR